MIPKERNVKSDGDRPPPDAPARKGLSHRIFAWLMARLSGRYERLVASRKEALFSEISGTVLEIGSGTGPNLRFAHSADRWIGVEPNVHMHQYFREQAEFLGVDAEVRSGDAQRLDAEDESVDWVVSTLVLCSVEHPRQALAEIHRVLRPGGRFIYLEHVAAPEGSWLRRIQSFVRPMWKAVADGCRPDRDTEALLRDAGFGRVELERFRLPLPVVSPHVAGVASKEG